MRSAKIVCTLGPATSTYDQIKQLIESGMNVARLNMSHGEHAIHAESYATVRRAAKELNRGVGIVADLQGPKIRLGRFADGPVLLEDGAEFTITTEDILGDVNQCGTTHKGLPSDCHAGDSVLVDDGKVKLEVVSVEGARVLTRVVEGGLVSNNKGINLPGVAVSVPALSEKDKEDLRWALRIGVDMLFLSFVRSADDVRDVHAIMDEVGRRIPVLAKVEKPQAVENLAEIVEAFDGVMVARGDLGVELPLEEVPIVQKRAVQMCREAAKPVIVATQMLESMMENSRPTRAEASDVANAVLDGADAVMLSGETSVGKHPNLVVRTMARIVSYTEEEGLERLPKLPRSKNPTIAQAITRESVDVAKAVGSHLPDRLHRDGRDRTNHGRVPPAHPDACIHSERADPSAAVGRLGHAHLAGRLSDAHRSDGRADRYRAHGGLRRRGWRSCGPDRWCPAGHLRLDQQHARPRHRQRLGGARTLRAVPSATLRHIAENGRSPSAARVAYLRSLSVAYASS